MKYLVFDLDDTLIPSSLGFQHAYESMGLELDCLGECKSAVKQILGEDHPSSHNRLLYFKHYLERQGQFSPQRALGLLQQYESFLTAFFLEHWEARNRSALLNELKKHYHLAILTNETLRTQLLKLKVIDPDGKFFQTVVTSEEAGKEKPHKKIFDILSSKLGYPPAENIWFIGDDVRCDLEPAIGLGWKAIQTIEYGKSVPSGKYPVIKSLEDLKNLNL